MTHENASQRLSAYRDGELPPAERAAVEQHVRECPGCGRVLAEYESLSRMMRQVALPAVDGALLARVQARVREAAQRPVERFVGLLSGIAACLALMGGLLLMRPAAAGAVLPPMSWEGQAVGILDEGSLTSVNASREAAIGQWMVSNLSVGGAEEGGRE